MTKQIRIITLIELAIAVLISFLLPIRSLYIAIGIIAGGLIGIIGFQMIVHLSASIELYENPKGQGMRSYVLRYIFYACTFALFMWKGVPILSLLVGMLCHKTSMYVYALLHRKED